MAGTRLMKSFDAASAFGPPSTSLPTNSATASSRSSSGTTWLMSPTSAARRAVIRSPVRNSSNASDRRIFGRHTTEMIAGSHADAHLGEADADAFRSDGDVACRGQPHAAAEAAAVQPPDDGLGCVHHVAEDRREEVRRPVLAAVGAEVRSGAERGALVRQHHDPHAVVGERPVQRGTQARHHLGAQGVVVPGPVQREGGHATSHLVPDGISRCGIHIC
jgi:hypothetical protein